MQSLPNVEQSSAAQVLTEYLSLLNQNAQNWEDLFAEDAVFESPYAPHTPGRLEGKAAICSFIKNALFQMQNLRFSNIRVYPTANPNLVWAEYHGEAVAVATSRSYQQDYVVKMETREGQIIFYCDYANPIATVEAWDGTENLQQSFNTK